MGIRLDVALVAPVSASLILVALITLFPDIAMWLPRTSGMG